MEIASWKVLAYYLYVVAAKSIRKRTNECSVFLSINPFPPRVKPWLIQSFLTFDFMDRNIKFDNSLESC